MLKISSSLKILLIVALFNLSAFNKALGNANANSVTELAMPAELAKSSPEKLESLLKPVTYGGLRSRLLVRISQDVKTQVKSPNDYSGDGTQLSFASYADAKKAGELRAGDFLRVAYANMSDSIVISGVGGGAWQAEVSEEKNINVAFIRMDANFKPVGEIFTMKAKTDPREEVDNMERVSGDLLSMLGPLRHDRALPGDILINVLDEKINGRTIPSGSRALVKSVSSQRIPWTLNYNYTLKLQLLDCPQEFRAIKCTASIQGTRGFPNQFWGHQVAAKNARIMYFMGFEFHY